MTWGKKPDPKQVAKEQAKIRKDLAKKKKARELKAREQSAARGVAKAKRGHLTQEQIHNLIRQQADIRRQKRSL